MRGFLADWREAYRDLTSGRAAAWVLTGTLMPGSASYRACVDIRRTVSKPSLDSQVLSA